jgi:EAL domain-containing protein (putative c-di-GMP-specific phosphodiesterase class I)
MEHGDTTVELLRHWRQLGLGLSIDDFGTGYSSLGYLKHFPIDALKIDRAFVRDVATAAGDAAITTAVLALGHALDLRVVAEGVETEAQLAFLRQQGCDLVQGFLIGRPMPAEEFTRRLRADRDPKARRTLARLA